MQLLDGKKYSEELALIYKEQVSNITLAIIQVGSNEANNIYVRNKISYCKLVGIDVCVYHIEENNFLELKELINKLNKDDSITGIILQSPTIGIDFEEAVNLIDPKKDVDGLTKYSISNLCNNKESIIPCTVKGIIKLLEHYNITIKNKNITILGRSNVVGKPLALALKNRGANITVCHSKTEDLSLYTKSADIIISAVGKPNLVTKEMVKDGFIGIDVGINKVDDKIVGDFDFDNIKSKASYITPVPKGVGPMTVSMIVDNLIILKNKK